MTGQVSRRRILGAAAALTTTAVLAASLRPWSVWGQSTMPEQVLTQLLTADQANPNWFSPALLKRASPQQIQQAVMGLAGLLGTFQSVTASGVDQYAAQFSGGVAQLHVTFDDELRIAAFGVAGLSYALAADEQELAFTSESDTLYGTLLVPAGVAVSPAALLIAGSGPTDRNGNSPLTSVQVNTLASLARALAKAGVASLRYDKFGAGKTGPGGHGPENPPTFATYLDEARAAYAALLAQPEVDATRTLIVGHSEGGLFAELLAQEEPLSGLLLAAPASVPILDTLRRQLIAQGEQALAAGMLTPDQYGRLRADLDATIASIRADGTIPPDVFADAPSVQAIFLQPGIGAYLQQQDSYDPAQLATQLPATLPVLVLRGELDMNVTEDELQHLLSGFQAAGNTAIQVEEFANVDHTLRQIAAGQTPVLTVAYPFSTAVAEAVTTFAGSLLWT